MSETDRAERPYREAAIKIIRRVKVHPDISTAHTEWAEGIIAAALAPTAAPEAPQPVGTDTRSRLIAFLATVGASTPDDHPWVQEARALADAVKNAPSRQPGADAELVERLRERLRFARSTHGTRVGGEPFTDRSVTVSASLIEDAIARLSAPAGERGLTIPEWNASGLFPFQVVDPDGFDRSDPLLMERRFMPDEFRERALRSTCVSAGEREARAEVEHEVWKDEVAGLFVRCAACGYRWNRRGDISCKSCDADGIAEALLDAPAGEREP